MPTFRWTSLSAEVLRGARFAGVGVGGLALDTAVFSLLHADGVSRPVARAVSLLLATGLTWGLNRWLTFHRSGRAAHDELGRYALVALIAQGFNYVLFLALGAALPTVAPQLLILVSAVAAAGLSYSGQRLFTFRPSGVAAPVPEA